MLTQLHAKLKNIRAIYYDNTMGTCRGEGWQKGVILTQHIICHYCLHFSLIYFSRSFSAKDPFSNEKKILLL